MKHFILSLSLIFFSVMSFAQAPQTLKYQTIIRDASGNIKANTNVSIGFRILQGSITGPSKCTESFDAQTNSFGLVNLEIGSVSKSEFSKIDWSNGPYFLSVDVDGEHMGTSQLVSVPYALHANTADSVITPKHFVGESFGGGIVFYVDHNGLHGLVCSKIDLGIMPWSNVTGTSIDVSDAGFLFDGKGNSEKIVSQPGHTNSAAKSCLDYINANYGTGVFDDWYLPSQSEFVHLWNNALEIQKALSLDGKSETRLNANYYWTSTQHDINQGRFFYFCYGYVGWTLRTTSYSVRAIRAF